MPEINYDIIQENFEKVYEIMRPFQRKGTAIMKRHKRVLLDYPTGAGKTLTTLTATFLQKPKKVLVLCSVNALYTWQKEIRKWYTPLADSYIVIRPKQNIKGKETRKEYRAEQWKTNHLVHVTTYTTARLDADLLEAEHWDVIICDECHRAGLRNRKSIGFKFIKQISKNIPICYLVTATPGSKGPEHLWPMFHICDRKTFSSYWKFAYTYCIVEDGFFGKQIIGVQNTEGYENITRHVYVRKSPAQLKDELPSVIRDVIEVDMTSPQLKCYNEMEEEMLSRNDRGELVYASTTLTQQLRLRQMLSSPGILGYSDPGAAIEAVVDFMNDVEERHCVIFTPFRAAIPHLSGYVKERWKDVRVGVLVGGTEPEEVKRVTEEFAEHRGVIFCTTSFAESFELPSADYCFFVGYEFDQGVNYQCEGRLARMTRKERPVKSYYIKHRHPKTGETVDDRVLEILRNNAYNMKTLNQDIDKKDT